MEIYPRHTQESVESINTLMQMTYRSAAVLVSSADEQSFSRADQACIQYSDAHGEVGGSNGHHRTLPRMGMQSQKFRAATRISKLYGSTRRIHLGCGLYQSSAGSPVGVPPRQGSGVVVDIGAGSSTDCEGRGGTPLSSGLGSRARSWGRGKPTGQVVR
ncbi:hypothetical protein PISMIDRAFT_596073 [Pisolithus microcarpus 441]|uniref:Uncharacterized protein n=1 Tax=Pisolithus microcarpus 441 TaxID=765257 RepID=A0A0C9YJT7_9AGAM|nr:hypothetical protein PISMIDRAFT_596073 [Pisolithus microcarpus 441]